MKENYEIETDNFDSELDSYETNSTELLEDETEYTPNQPTIKKYKNLKTFIILVCIVSLVFCIYKAYNSYIKAEYNKVQAAYYLELREYTKQLVDNYEDLFFQSNGLYSYYIYSEYGDYSDLYNEYNNDYNRYVKLKEKYEILYITYFAGIIISAVVPFIASKKIKEKCNKLQADTNFDEEPVLLRLFDEKRAKTFRVHGALRALKAQPIIFSLARQLGFKFLFSRSENACRLHKKIFVFRQPSSNTSQQQLELCRISLLHKSSQPFRFILSYHAASLQPCTAILQKQVPYLSPVATTARYLLTVHA